MSEAEQDVSTFLSASAQEWPDAPALVSGAKRSKFQPFSFSKLNLTVDQATAELRRSRIMPGDKALLFVNPGPDLVIWAFALFRAGAIPVIIDPGMGIRSFLSCIRRTKPNAMVGMTKAFWLSRLLPRAFRCVKKKYLVRSGFYGQALPSEKQWGKLSCPITPLRLNLK